MPPESDNVLLSVEDLHTHFLMRGGVARAVDGVSFSIRERETVALVGESGCGKSVTALSLARLVPQPPGHYAGGRILFRGRDILRMGEKELGQLRGRDISYVFQEPAESLNPVFTVGYQIEEALRLHRPDAPRREEVLRLMTLVGLPDPEQRMSAYPHQLSGGMQQRAMIAMALACNPALLVADEPTTALDVTIQAQIMELLGSLQQRLGMAVLLITHNLGLVADVAHRINVMYAGRIVESGPTERVLRNPRHPYTRGLLDAVPRIEGTAGRLKGIEGTVPNPRSLPAGCAFHPRCFKCQARCRTEEPGVEKCEEEHEVRCHFWRT
ncbi:MAG: Oligopeptide transport ATP-binding protein OppD [Verrucomicrobia bacterium ADurb.Bin345]|nr:MAG: Oligopeptide transport ATP-binding protein OppD [Verrucomicrobia bacterium ADurb.Bin345]